MQARADMHTGKAVEIPAVGKFVEERGKVVFVTDPNFVHTPPPIPTMKFTKREEPTYPETTSTYNSTSSETIQSERDIHSYQADDSNGISWAKIGVWVAILAALGVLAYFGIRYMNQNSGTKDMPLIVEPQKDSNQSTSSAPVTDTTLSVEPTATIANADGMLSFDVVLNTYNDMGKAMRRADKLKSYGNDVSMKSSADSTVFYVVMPVANVAAIDTASLLDSLRRNFNPNGVSIMR